MDQSVSKKHAYLLSVHGNQPVVGSCIRMLDDPRNDIFILTDPAERAHYRNISTIHSRVFILESEVEIIWGGTVYLGMLELIKKAVKEGDYSYLHLLSESCLPIKTQDEIHSFFDSDSAQKIYMHVNCHTFREIQERCMTRYPFVNRRWFRKHKSIKALALAMVKIKIAFGVNRLRSNKEIPVIWNGWNWFSIPGDFAAYVVEKESLLRYTFDDTLAADEVFLQSLAMNSHFKDRMYGFNGRDDAQDASKRMIRWNPKHWTPLVFTIDGYDDIVANKNCFFARKFYANVDMEIVRKIETTLKERSAG